MNTLALAFTLLIIIASLGIIFLVSQWDLSKVSSTPTNGEKSWVLLQPTQCTEIPWRRAWANQNGKNYSDFPVTNELQIAKAYYTGKGLTIFDATITYRSVDAACTVCGCPEPFVFAIQTYQGDAAKLGASGFKILDPQDPSIFTGPLFRQNIEQPLNVVSAKECEGIFATGTFLDDILGSKKDSCYIQAAINLRSVEECKKVVSSAAKNTCYSEVATAQKSTATCQLISDSTAKAYCIANVAGALKDKKLCAQITESSAKIYCNLAAG